MERFVLKQEIVDKIKNDQLLYGEVAYLMDTAILSMRAILNDRSEKLTQASVLNHLKKKLGYEKDSDLLEVIPDPEHKTNINNSILQEVH